MEETRVHETELQVADYLPSSRKDRGGSHVAVSVKSLIVTLAVVLLAIVAGVAGYYYFDHMDQWVSTNNAHVDGRIYTISSAIPGIAETVRAADTGPVSKGDLLLTLDARLQRIAVEKTKAAIETNQLAMQALRNVPGRVAELNMAQARHEELILMLEEAQILYDKTKIMAPSDGYVASVLVRPSEFVNPGQPLKYVISHDSLWITANFTETQIRNIKIGNEVDIYVDAFPNENIRGRVISIAPAGGGVFALFPPDATAGNWVRTPQKIPVEIAITETIARDTILRVGMLARVRVER